MDNFHFSIPIDVRYGDLDPQWHVNNSRFLTYLEHARMAYVTQLGLFKGNNFFEFNLIVADIHITYLAPIKLGQPVRVWLRTERIGNKSLTYVYEIRDDETQQVLAKAETIMVTYDYHQQQSIPVPESWRNAISALEGVDFTQKT
jgi:acyl-CoA thioester hydrolase